MRKRVGKNSVNIVYASDNNFAEVLATSLTSLFENNKSVLDITVYILDDKISSSNKEKIVSIFVKYNRICTFIEMPDINEISGVEIKAQRWSLSTFSRLFLTKILPNEISKILYIDCDVLINGSIEELYNTELLDEYCGGVLDCISAGHRKNIGLSPKDKYVNAGILLISLENWRKDNVLKDFITFMQDYDGTTPYVDQGVINGVLSHKIKIVHPKFNSMTVGYDFRPYKTLMKYRNPSIYYSEEELEESLENPIILHFTSSFLSLRPWVKGSTHPFASEWVKYKSLTPWGNTELWEDKRSFSKKFLTKIFKCIPKSIAVILVGFLHTKVVPLKRQISINKVKRG